MQAVAGSSLPDSHLTGCMLSGDLTGPGMRMRMLLYQ